MSFSYNFGANPSIDYPRLLIADTVDTDHIFEDSEITAIAQVQGLQWQSGMFYSPPGGANLPSSPVPYLRVAALLLDCIASNKARLASVSRILDVNLNTGISAKALREQAAEYRAIDDDAGAFAIIEQCRNVFSFRDRFWAQVQRQSGGGF